MSVQDSTVILNWIQTIGVLFALGLAICEIRSRRKEQHFSNYFNGIYGFIDDTKLLVENNDLHGLYDYSSDDIEAEYSEISDVFFNFQNRSDVELIHRRDRFNLSIFI